MAALSRYRTRLRQIVALPFICVPAVMAAGCAANRPPIASAGANQVVSAGAKVKLDGSASRDPDGKSLSFSWKQTVGTSVSLSSTSAPIVTLTAPAHGTTLMFELTVSDGKSESVARTDVSVHPVDQSAQVIEVRQRPITDDPAVSGNWERGWTRAAHPETPPQPANVDPAEGAFQQLYAVRFAPPVEVRLAPGATREVALDVTGGSVLLGSARWEGTTRALDAAISLDGSRVATGGSYSLGTNRGGASLRSRTTVGGRATLSVTNTSGVEVTVKLTLGSLAP